MRRLAVSTSFVLAVLVLTASALAAKGDPQKRHTAADMALARAVLVTRPDLGPGWSAKAQRDSDDDFECASLAVDESHLVETGTADSPYYDHGPLVGLTQSVGVYRTAADAAASWRTNVHPKVPACFREAFDGKTVNGVKIDVVRVSRLAFPAVAPRTAAYRMVSTMTASGRRLHAQMDFVLLGRGRTFTLVAFSGIEQKVPMSFERDVARIVAMRLARAS